VSHLRGRSRRGFSEALFRPEKLLLFPSNAGGGEVKRLFERSTNSWEGNRCSTGYENQQPKEGIKIRGKRAFPKAQHKKGKLNGRTRKGRVHSILLERLVGKELLRLVDYRFHTSRKERAPLPMET